MTRFLRVVAAVTGLAVTAATSQALAERRDRRRFPPPGRLVDVGGHRLHLVVRGEDRGRPTVVLDAGMVSFSANWAWVQPDVAAVTRVVAVDRAGLGWSDRGPGGRDAVRSARELRAALAAADLPGPYVLAGHSYGGLTCLAFTALYRDEVAGLVLVDGSHPDQWAEFGFPSKVVALGTGIASVLARFGVLRVLDGEYRLLAAGLPPRQRAELLAFAPTPRALSTASSAARVWDDVSRPFVNTCADLGDLPLTVLGVTEQPRKGEELTALQERLAGLSTNSRRLVVQGAYHEGLISRPEFARTVAEEITSLARAVASSGDRPQTGR